MQLPQVALRVLGGMEEETQYGRWQLRPPYSSRLAECPLVRSAQLHQGVLHLLTKGTNQVLRAGRWLASLPFGREGLPLSGGKSFAAGIREEPVQYSGEMLQMKADGGHTRRSGPEQIIREAVQ